MSLRKEGVSQSNILSYVRRVHENHGLKNPYADPVSQTIMIRPGRKIYEKYLRKQSQKQKSI